MSQYAEMETGSADAKGRVFAVASIVTLVIALTISAGVFYITFSASKSFGMMFEEMETKLPLLTVCVLSPAFYLILPVLAIAGVIKELLIRNRLVTFLINGIHICLAILVGTICQLGLFLPMIQLMENMGES